MTLLIDAALRLPAGREHGHGCGGEKRCEDLSSERRIGSVRDLLKDIVAARHRPPTHPLLSRWQRINLMIHITASPMKVYLKTTPKFVPPSTVGAEQAVEQAGMR